MEKKYVYTNNCILTGLFVKEIEVRGEPTNIATLQFSCITNDARKEVQKKSVTMFLTQDSNEKNIETLKTLGATGVTDKTFVTVELMKSEIQNLGSNVVDLVSHEGDDERNARYINARKFAVKYWERNNSEKSPF